MMITDDPAEAKAAGEALWAVTKEAEKKMKDAQDDEDLDDLDEEEEDEIKEGDDEEAEGHDELTMRTMRISTILMKRRRTRSRKEMTKKQRATMSCEVVRLLVFIKHVLVLCGALCKPLLDPSNRILGSPLHCVFPGHSQVNFIQRLL